MGPDMYLECDAGDLFIQGDAWKKIRDEILQSVCAALNSHYEEDEDTAQSEWTLRIHIKNKKPKGFVQALAERIEDKLSNMIQKSRFSQVFAFEEGEDHVTLRILQGMHGVSTLDFKSPQATEKGLVPTNRDHFCFFMFGSCHDEDVDTSKGNTLRREKIFEEKIQNGQLLEIQECPFLQIKSLKSDQTRQKAKKAGSQARTFSPQSGRDYVEWLWSKSTRTVGEYIAAFAKNKGKGGYFYCGLEEKKSEIKIGKAKKMLITGYEVNALELQGNWDKEIKTELSKRIREEMLWVKSDPAEGYRILKPEEVKEEQVKIDFIKVEGKAKEGFRLYLLEVKVAPFNGVVFSDRNGPEAYKLQRTEDKHGYRPVRMRMEDWFQEMGDFGWCSKHVVPKDMKCGTYFLCSQCLPAGREERACIEHRLPQEHPCERCGGP